MSPLLTNHRRVTPEIMDGPDIAEAAHLDALEGLRRINEASKAAQRIAGPIVAMARREGLARISMLDVACGGGDVPIGVAQRAQSAGIGVDLILLDRSETALGRAGAAAERAGIACRCVRADLTEGWPELSVDVVTCSLFLHHIREGREVVDFLRKAKVIARRQIVVSDLRRSRIGWLIAWVGGRMLSGSKIVHHDGPASVRAAWTMREMSEFAADARLTGARVERSFPWRMLLVWEATGERSA